MPPPRSVLLNALYLDPGVSGGPETYLRGLAPALAREAPGLRMTIATTRSGAAALREDGWGSFARILSLPCEDGQRARRQLCEQVALPRLVRRLRPELVHSLASLAPLAPGAPAVVTLHDVTFLLTPTFGAVTSAGMELLVRAAAARAARLISGSAAARDEICAVLGADPARFDVVHHGYEQFRGEGFSSERDLRARLQLGAARVVLCLAAKRPHKNQEVLVRAAAELDDGVVILLAGHAEPYEQQLSALARELGVQSRIRFAGYVSDADREGLWRIAACSALPTLGEGFGLPVIEALGHGVPVACSRLAVLREVGGELPHYFDPHDPSDAARALAAALADSTTARTGPARAAEFTWQAAAQGTLRAYERALAR
jgi:glycosyltransferase involved in cell wall biosynthesis